MGMATSVGTQRNGVIDGPPIAVLTDRVKELTERVQKASGSLGQTLDRQIGEDPRETGPRAGDGRVALAPAETPLCGGLVGIHDMAIRELSRSIDTLEAYVHRAERFL
jgi:hypothetical protein